MQREATGAMEPETEKQVGRAGRLDGKQILEEQSTLDVGDHIIIGSSVGIQARRSATGGSLPPVTKSVGPFCGQHVCECHRSTCSNDLQMIHFFSPAYLHFSPLFSSFSPHTPFLLPGARFVRQ
jgi:hypothetical protein